MKDLSRADASALWRGISDNSTTLPIAEQLTTDLKLPIKVQMVKFTKQHEAHYNHKLAMKYDV